MYKKITDANGKVHKLYGNDRAVLKKLFQYIDNKKITNYEHLYNHFPDLPKIEIDNSIIQLQKENKLMISTLQSGKTVIKSKIHEVFFR